METQKIPANVRAPFPSVITDARGGRVRWFAGRDVGCDVGWASAHRFHRFQPTPTISTISKIPPTPPETETAESRRFAKTLDAVKSVG